MNWKIYDASGELVNTIYADREFVEQYCEVNGYTHEQEETPKPGTAPTADERLAALESAVLAMMGGADNV